MNYKILHTKFELRENGEFAIKELKIDGNSLFLHQLLTVQEDTTYYVDDLNILYIYIIKFLKDNDISFDFSYKNGKCSNIKVTNGTTHIFFVNYKSKFGIDFDEQNEENNIKIMNYAISHGRNRLSLGADAYNEFLHTIFKQKAEENANHKLIRENFPVFPYTETMLEAKKNVYGYQYAKPGRYKNIFDYDISGSYPASAFCDTPEGFPQEYDCIENVPKSYFKIIKFTYYNCKLKNNGISFVKTKSMGQLVLTQRLFEEFLSNYDVKVKIKKIIAFKTRKSMFAKFITQTVIHGKTLEKDPQIAKYNKYIGNAIIGYMGRNTTTERNTMQWTQKDGYFIETTEEEIEPIYLPAYLCILDTAKSKFIRSIRPFYKSIIYCNTDGFLSKQEIDLQMLNLRNTNHTVGNFRLCHKYSDIYLECLNGYSGITEDGELINTISGMRFERVLTPEQYQNKNFVYYVNEPTANGTIRHRIIKIKNNE